MVMVMVMPDILPAMGAAFKVGDEPAAGAGTMEGRDVENIY